MADIPQLPPHLLELVAEVEARAATKIVWIKSPDIAGDHCVEIADGVPTISYRVPTEAGIAEELLHLRLLLGATPAMTRQAHLIHVDQAVTILVNLVHHRLIFPTLKQWGYDPNSGECRGVASQLDVVETVDQDRLAKEKDLEALLALIYARAELFCDASALLSRARTLYSSSRLERAYDLGSRVVRIIQACTDSSFEAVRATLSDCVEVLGLSGSIRVGTTNA